MECQCKEIVVWESVQAELTCTFVECTVKCCQPLRKCVKRDLLFLCLLNSKRDFPHTSCASSTQTQHSCRTDLANKSFKTLDELLIVWKASLTPELHAFFKD